ncbi:TPM domain-containing protein [Sphingomonas sp. VNH70]|uniref:TPM domain-containing protein n=1 Tax=Sphingomonas silueang TaxID=3156617 RepID=UPI0032B4C825
MRLSAQDHARIGAAVAAAEAATNGEIVVITAPESDRYHDVPLHFAVLAMLLVLAGSALWPGWLHAVHGWVEPWGEAPSPAFLFTVMAWVQAAVFLIVRYGVGWPPLRMALTPRATKARRVHARALMLFRAAAEQRTVAATGVLLYLSMAEHRAELIADASIHDRVDAAVWGDALAAVLGGLRDGRAADGIVAAVGAIGTVLAEHFPRGDDDVNELPDRVIEL